MRTLGVGFVVGMLLVGCDPPRGTDAGAIVADSAGVRIVLNEAPAWSLDERWYVEESPRTEIGAVEGEAAYLLDRVIGAVTLSDGRIAVADLGSSQVRVFDPNGRHLLSVGGPGEGPEEFRAIVGILRLPDDALGVVDRYQRIQVLEADGRFGSNISIGLGGGLVDPVMHHLNPARSFEVIGAFDGGVFVGREASALTLSPTRQFEEPERQQLRFATYALDDAQLQELGEIVQVEGPTFHPHPMNVILRTVFGPDVLHATHEGSLVLGLSADQEIRWYGGDGSLDLIARLAWPVRAVTDDMVAQYLDHSSPPLREPVARGRTFAEELPPFSDLRIDREGNVWLRRYEPQHATTVAEYLPTFDLPSTWAVISSDGRWLGDVVVPASLHVIEIGEEFLLGLHRDDFDVEYLRVHELQKR